jgi:hypothetical protein
MTRSQLFLELLKNPKKLSADIRKKVNTDLHPMGTVYHPHIPMGDIKKILEKYGLIMLQEDNTEWSGFFTGSDATAHIDLGFIETKNDEGTYTPIDNSSLNLQWHKMDSGRYELVAYLG